MAITVQDILKLKDLEHLQLVAGEGGLHKVIKRAEILDFEFMEEGVAYREDSFIGDSIVLTSLLYAKDKPELIRSSIQKLHDFNVHALAIKPVIYQEIPEDALRLADELNLPVFVFGEDSYFEDICYVVRMACERESTLESLEPILEGMLFHYPSEQERRELIDKINPNLRPYIKSYCIDIPEFSAEDVGACIKRLKLTEELQRCAAVCRFRGMFLVIISGDRPLEEEFEDKFQRIHMLLGLGSQKERIGISEIRPLDDTIDTCFLQAYWAENFIEAEAREGQLQFTNMGVGQLYIPWPETPSTERFAQNYMKPLMDIEDEKNEELLHTAQQYVSSHGDLDEASLRLSCHKNTIRYRLGKIQQKLDPDASEKVFYQNLSAAIKILQLIEIKNRSQV